MRYNDVIEVEVIDTTSGDITLDEVKRHLNLLFDTEGSFEFDDDDTYLQDLIDVCRTSVEQYTGLNLISKTMRAVLRNECGDIEIPFGPVEEVAEVKDQDDNDILSSTTIRGNKFKWIEGPQCGYLVIDYTSGYTQMPTPLRHAVLEEIAFRYSNRGDQQQEYANADVSLCQSAMNLAAPYKRRSWVA